MASTNASEQTSRQASFEELRVLLGKNIQGNVRLFNRLTTMVQEASKELSAGNASGKLPKGNELLSRWLELNLNYYSLLTEHGLALFDDLLSAAEKTLGLKAATPSAEPSKPPARVEINQSGRVGETVVAPFVMENQHSSPLEVSFHASDLVSVKGTTVSAGCINFEPRTLSLQPKQQAIVKAIVTITREFEVGETYATTINVVGFQARDITFLITILPALEEKKPRGRRASSKKQNRVTRTEKTRKS